jgi:hypothetical protein
MLCFFTQPKEDNNQFKNRKPPETARKANCVDLWIQTVISKVFKEHSFSLVGGVEIGSQGRKGVWQDCAWQSRIFHMQLCLSWEAQLWNETDCTT